MFIRPLTFLICVQSQAVLLIIINAFQRRSLARSLRLPLFVRILDKSDGEQYHHITLTLSLQRLYFSGGHVSVCAGLLNML